MFKTLILQIDSLNQLKTNSGFWDNFVWPLVLAGVIGIFTLLYKAFVFLYIKFVTKNDDNPEIELYKKLSCVEVKSFIELCTILITLLSDNKYIFLTYGPNSSADQSNELRTDMTLWHNARTDYIVPNNRVINCLIEKNEHLIPESFKSVLRKLTAHIYAFEKHVQNPAFDYTEYQFPKEIEKLIKDECFAYTINQDKEFLKIDNWIRRNLKTKQVLEAYLFGSVLFSTKYNRDVDVVIILKNMSIDDMLKFENEKTKINESFRKVFKKHLHIEVFTNNEHARFGEFLNCNLYTYKI